MTGQPLGEVGVGLSPGVGGGWGNLEVVMTRYHAHKSWLAALIEGGGREGACGR